ncbi:MAG: RNA-binding domain-containing protein, partial [Candidatus Thermoplasmatota archaeon]
LSLRAFAHETEDVEKVRQALRNAAHVTSVPIEETVADGSHGNRIRILEATVKSAAAERALFRALERDEPGTAARLSKEAPDRLDDHLNFFLRLDKQAAFQGRFVLAKDDDAITARAKARSFPAKGEDPRLQVLLALRDALERVRSPKLD